jgi:hypothetical protein
MGLVELGGLVERSMRRRGQRLVVSAALVGALAGGVLGTAADDARPSAGAAAPEARAARAAPAPAVGEPSGSQATGDGSPVAAGPTGRRGGDLGRADRRDHKAEKDREHAREPKGGHGKGRPGKDEGGRG